MKTTTVPFVALTVIALVNTASAQTIVNEQFNYPDTAAMSVNWQMGSAPLSLSTGAGNGNPPPSAFHPGTTTSPNIWIGSTFSLSPSDAHPVRLTADIWSAGNAQTADTVGLRQSGGANPLFEMGMYRSFDNVQTGPSTATLLSPTQDGIGVRTISLGVDLNAQDWVKMRSNYIGWARWQATFTASNLVTRVDLGADGTWDLSYTEFGTNAIAPFSELRIHSPAVGTGGGFRVDNILLEVVPLALFDVTGGGAGCDGAPVGLSGSEVGVTYLLHRNSILTGVAVEGTGSAISFGNQTVPGVYSVLASNTTTTVTTLMAASVVVTIMPPAAITSGASPVNFTNYQGGYLTFAVTATGASLSYQWQRDGTNLINGGRISGATTNALSVYPADPADSTGPGHGYVCIVSNSCLTVTSAEAIATVLPFSPGPESISGVWTNRYNGLGRADDVATRMIKDSSGNFVMTGSSDNYLTGKDLVTTKYSSTGTVLWTQRYNGTANRDDVPQGVAADTNGDIIVSGYSFNGANNDYYIAKYAGTDGAVLWQTNYIGLGNTDNTATAAAVDAAGNVLVTGQSGGTNSVVKYAAADGALIWAQRTNGTGNLSFTSVAVAVDTNGDVVVTGEAWVAPGHWDFYTIKYSGLDGSVLWQRRYDGLGKDDGAAALALDAAGNVVVAGRSVASGSANDFLIEKYASADGALLWQRRFYDSSASTRQDRARALALDADGNVAVTGYVTDSGGGFDYFTVKLAAATGATLWWKRYGGSPNLFDQPYAVTVDYLGNVIVAGASATSTGVDFYTIKYATTNGAQIWAKRSSGMVMSAAAPVNVVVDSSDDVVVAGKMTPLATGRSDFYLARYAAADATLIWEQTYDGPGNQEDTAKCVAVDAAGNVVVAGNSSLSGTTGTYDFYTVKYSPGGSVIWSRAFVSTNGTSDELAAMALDPAGNVIVVGTSGNDYYCAKYAAADGALLWEQRYANPANNIDEARSVAVDAGGNVIVAGRSYASATGFDYYTAKYAAMDGALIWERRYSALASSQFDEASAIAVDTAGDVYVTGNSYSGTNPDFYTAKYAAADGAVIWEKRYNGPANNNDYGKALCVDTNGDVIVVGRSSNGANDDYYTAKYAAADGALLWEQRYNSGAADAPAAITSDPSGNVLVTGFAQGLYCHTVKYEGGTGLPLWSQRLTNSNQNFDFPIAIDASGDVIVAAWLYVGGKTDFHTVKLASENGELLWSAIYNGPVNGNDQFYTRRALAIGPSGEIVVAGGSDGQLNYSAAGNRDFLTIKYSPDATANARPEIALPLADAAGSYGAPFNYTFPANAFTDPDAGQLLSYSANSLPPGITFTAATRTFSGTPTSVGTSSVTVTATDNGSPALNTNDVFDIVISKVPLTVTADNQSRTYAETNLPLTFSYSSFVLGESAADLDTSPVAATTATNGSSVGSYPITVGDGVDDHYDFSYANGSLNITPAPLTVTGGNTNRVYGTPNPAFTGSLAGVAWNDNISVTFTTAATITDLPGTYPIVPVWSDADGKLGNYSVSTNLGTLTILSPPELTFSTGGGSGLFTLSWPANYSGFVLEYTENLTPPVDWHEVTTGITESGGIKSYTVTNDPGTLGRLYRLRLP